MSSPKTRSTPSKDKAIDLVVESEKLYFTISTISIAALVSYFSSEKNSNTYNWLFYISILILFSSAIASIWFINILVADFNSSKEVNLYDKSLIGLNWFSIFSFFIGIIIGLGYIYCNSKNRIIFNNNPKNELQNNIISIEKNSLKIGSDIKTKVQIKKNQNGEIIEININ
jgi:hypothetical protein